MVCAVVLAAVTRFGSNSASTTTQLATWATVPLLVTLTVVLRLLPAERLDRAGVLLGCAVGGVLLVDVLNLVTRDASAAAQAWSRGWSSSRPSTRSPVWSTAGCWTTPWTTP